MFYPGKDISCCFPLPRYFSIAVAASRGSMFSFYLHICHTVHSFTNQAPALYRSFRSFGSLFDPIILFINPSFSPYYRCHFTSRGYICWNTLDGSHFLTFWWYIRSVWYKLNNPLLLQWKIFTTFQSSYNFRLSADAEICKLYLHRFGGTWWKTINRWG